MKIANAKPHVSTKDPGITSGHVGSAGGSEVLLRALRPLISVCTSRQTKRFLLVSCAASP